MGLADIDNIPETGAVFTLGRSRFADNVASHFFIRKDPVVTVACGDEHSAVVCQSGRLFVFGSNDWGQLGLGHKNHVSKPSCVKVLKPEKVTHVACGRAHTLVCTTNRKIFACGSDQEAQLGRGSNAVGDSSSWPVMVHDCGVAGPKLLQIVAGSHHSLALTSDGNVLAWGSNLEGQLGLAGTCGLVNKPTRVNIPEPVKQMSAGYYHSAFLTESGNVYVCGEAESGKLGIPLDFRTQVAPKLMQLSTPAAVVACGGHHTLILDESGQMYCTGSNASGQLGMGSEVTEIPTPKLLPCEVIQDEIIKKIGCGESHVAIVTDSGNLYTCGDGRHGKLGLEENENNVHQLTRAIKYQELVVTDVSCGGCHTILVGRRRDDDNEDADKKDQQIVRPKKNPLPPLKIPAPRIPNETSADTKPEEISSDSNEKINNAINNESTNGIEKPESPKKMSDYEDAASKISMTDADPANGGHAEEEEETINGGTIETSVDADDKVIGAEVEEPETTKSPRVDGTVEELEKSSDSIRDEAEIVEKPSSPPLPVPPPKPPRQKMSSAENSTTSSRQGSSSSRLGSAANGEPETATNPSEETAAPESQLLPEVEAQEMADVGEEKTIMSDEESRNKSISEKSGSAKSEADTDEADQQNGIRDIAEHNEPVEDKTEIIADEADVVHSPVPRTGKMTKLFKGKKQEGENGTKASSTSTKAKSKTCNIL